VVDRRVLGFVARLGRSAIGWSEIWGRRDVRADMKMMVVGT